ncbi:MULTISPECIES: PilZ domain-containing protein [Pseudoalteromonas]|uniref:PilZ domain-containing protein n=1 Tax=Pseudoalteromonas TaxID=53246 RepID=UPI000783D4A8|nr:MULTISPECIES: PilZ domain-containing protein [Gammaproteobacteria]MCF7518755.1 PilZ domain-containing protein [Pseudoalteromonas sp. L21]UJX26363.1 PilZ domain-containing protein [Pseudoalteromonas sp. CF6-2]|tara:strand:- start:2466 stop:2855 length:390 start_codon:yes stop_codon:yes gene_type:complete
MNKSEESKRTHPRWPLCEQDTQLPAAMQQGGIAVKLHHSWLFNYFICRAVVKDISVGGAGMLVPNEHKLPGKVRVAFNDSNAFIGTIRYTYPVTEKLNFVGIEWQKKDELRRIELVAELQKQANYTTTL